jgi:arginine-tRNA-protein transferase
MQKLVYDGSQSCPYLPGRVARMPLYRQLRRLTLAEADARFANAERRVGACLYTTACATCRACEGLRIPVADFRPSKSQRRLLNRWRDVGRIEYGAPTFSEEKLDLFNRHKVERGLNTDDDRMTEQGYVGWLVHSCFQTMEMRYFLEDRLVGVGIVDLGQTALSSVYFYFDPDPAFAKYSPGTYSVLQEIAFGARTGRHHLYLGLYVAGCSHLNYKANFHPHERLLDGDWRRFGKES